MLTISVFAQPQGRISYQAVIRDSSGELLTNQVTGIRISLLQGSAAGAAVYNEIQVASTNANGLLSIVFGGAGLNNINWEDGPYFIQIEIDPTGGDNYSITGVTQILTVPFAFHENTAEGITGEIEYTETDPVFEAWDRSEGIVISEAQISDLQPYITQEAQTLADVAALGNSVNVQIKDLEDPTDPQDAATKSYVDQLEEKLNALLAFYEGSQNPPLVTTAPVTEITSVSALGGGNVINDGGSDVYLRGLVWNTEGMPTVENYTGNTVVSGGLGEFESQISGLDQGTLYYVRAFAVNDFGPGYGSQVSFETSTDDNTYLLTIDISPINGGEAAGAGEYAAGSEVNVVASPNEGYQFVNWEGDNDHVEDIFSLNTVLIMPAGNTNLIAVFDEEEEDDNGGGNGEPGDGVTDIDDNFYPSVIIGDQEWMAANLRVTRYKNGVSIPTELDDTQWALTTSGAYAVYPHTDVDGLDSAADVVDAYGKLYNWYAVSDPGGLCPTGWRVPTHDDWTELEQFVCEQLGNEDCVVKFPFNASTMGWRGTNEGMALKSCRQLDHPYDEECNTTEHPRWGNFYMYNGFDEFGFSGLPGGSRQGDGSFHNISGFVGYWSSTEGPNASHAWYRALNLFFGNVNRFSNDMGIGHSVRCIREN